MEKLLRVQVVVPMLVIFLAFVACSKNSGSKEVPATGKPPHQVIVLQQSPPPSQPAPAILTLVCTQHDAFGNCTNQQYQCTFSGVPLSWPANTNFVYQIGTPGTTVGAPLPTVDPSVSYGTTVSQDGTPAPFGTFVVTQWSMGISNCSGNYNSQVDSYYADLLAYLNNLADSPNAKQPNIDTYLQKANLACIGGQPTSISIPFKLVFYSMAPNGAPTFACVPLNWVGSGIPVN